MSDIITISSRLPRNGIIVNDHQRPETDRISLIKAALRISLFWTIYLSARYGGRIIVFRGTRIHLKRGAIIRVARGARLILGQTQLTASPCSLTITRNARLVINGNVTVFRGTRIVVCDDAELEIGDNTVISFESTIMCWKRITIGSNCLISWTTSILDGNAHELIVGGVPRPRLRPVHIGDNVWFGVGVIVIGTTIGDGSVVAAGSVVTSDIPAKVVAGGNPARTVREDVSWQL
jgi:acetyltransferase-like isoleucine patch superfamily enzyme